MTFTDIQNRVADRLNLTSTAALTRIGQEINERYREVMSSVGLNTSIRTPVTANTVVGDRNLTFTCEKVFAVYDASVSPQRVLGNITWDEMQNRSVGTDPAKTYAIKSTGASAVIIYLSSIPGTIYTLTADAEVNLTDLSGTNVPAFPQDFHDILVRGVMADELYKMEKYPLSDKQELKFQQRLSDLRMFIAKAPYLDIYQSKAVKGRPTFITNSD